MAPHSMVLCMVGTGLLWVGWYGFNAGSALAPDGIAANAFMTTTLATAVASDEPTKDSLAQMIDHLRTNGVDFAKTPTVVGPLLRLSPKAESFVSREQFDIGYFANTMLSREYRKPFVVPAS